MITKKERIGYCIGIIVLILSILVFVATSETAPIACIVFFLIGLTDIFVMVVYVCEKFGNTPLPVEHQIPVAPIANPAAATNSSHQVIVVTGIPFDHHVVDILGYEQQSKI